MAAHNAGIRQSHASTMPLKNLHASPISYALYCHREILLQKSSLTSRVYGFPRNHVDTPSSDSNGTPASTASTATLLCIQTINEAPRNVSAMSGCRSVSQRSAG